MRPSRPRLSCASRRLAAAAVLVGALSGGLAGPAWAALEPEAPLTVRKVAKPAPSPTPTPAAAPVLHAGWEAPAIGWASEVAVGEVRVQQGGLTYGLGRADDYAVGTSALGVAMRGRRDDLAWTYKSTTDRQNAQWLLSEINLTGTFDDKSRFAVGDEQVQAGPLVMEAVPVRGVHAALGPERLNTRVFFGQDRPALNAPTPQRVLTGIESDLAPATGWPVYARAVFADAPGQGRWGSAASLGSRLQLGTAQLAGELAASTSAGPADAAWNLEAHVPIQGTSLGASYVRLGPQFQVIRGLNLAPEGGHEAWSAGWDAPLPHDWRARLSLSDMRSNLGGQPTFARLAQRAGEATLVWAPPGALGVGLSYGRMHLRSGAGDWDLESDYHRVSSEVRFPTPYSGQNRLYWQWWQNAIAGRDAQATHQLGLRLGRLLASPLSANEAFTLNAAGPARLTHTLLWESPMAKDHAQLTARAYFDHPTSAAFDASAQLGCALGLQVPTSATESLQATAQADRRLDGTFSSVRWTLGYTARFGSPHRVEADPAARIAGRVQLLAGTPDLPVDRLSVVLDRVRRIGLDADGRFAFDNVPPGPHAVTLDTARLPIAFAVPIATLTRHVEITPGRRLEELVYSVGPAHHLEGRVTLATGAGAGFVGIRLEGPEPAETWTDADGRFAFDGVPAGHVVVRLAPPPSDGDYTWGDQAVELELAGGRTPPAIAFTVAERTRPIRRITLTAGTERLEVVPARRATRR